MVGLKWHGNDFLILLKFTTLVHAFLTKGISNGQIVISDIQNSKLFAMHMLTMLKSCSCFMLSNKIHVPEISPKKI